jgi:hypothetical protein
MPIKEIGRNYSVSDAGFYKWRSKSAGMDASDAKCLRELELENGKLRGVGAGHIHAWIGSPRSFENVMAAITLPRRIEGRCAHLLEFGETQVCGFHTHFFQALRMKTWRYYWLYLSNPDNRNVSCLMGI